MGQTVYKEHVTDALEGAMTGLAREAGVTMPSLMGAIVVSGAPVAGGRGAARAPYRDEPAPGAVSRGCGTPCGPAGGREGRAGHGGLCIGRFVTGGRVAEKAYAPDLGSGLSGFESRLSYQTAVKGQAGVVQR